MESGDDRSEALDLIGAAREMLVDLLEEGVDALPSVKVEALPEPDVSPTSATSAPEGITPKEHTPPPPRKAPTQPIAPTVEVADWGPNPTLEAVRETLGDCQRCGLCEGRQSIVFGSGNPKADILFVGEGPGEQEDRQGLPFVGRAGELLTKMIEGGIHIPRDDVYICNIVKCRPPKNRNPLPDEVAACRPFLDGQIAAIQPKVIVTLGKPAAGLLLGREVAITRERGTWQDYNGIPLMPTLHPAYVLRKYTPENRRNVWEDLKQAVERART